MVLRRRAAALAIALAALALAAPAGASAADCPGADLVPDADNLGQVADATVCLLNAERAAGGLGSVSRNGALDQASMSFSQRMVAEAFFAHNSPDGGTLVDRLTGSGYLGGGGAAWAVGENIAWGQAQLSTPASIVRAWMESPGHRANILSDHYGEIGIGLALGTPVDRSWGATYTTDFGSRGDRADDGAAEPADAEPRTTTTPQATTAAKAPAKPAAAKKRTGARRGSCRLRAARGARASRAAKRARANCRRAAAARAAKRRA